MEFLGIPYKSLSFPGNDGPNEGQNDEKMMAKMMKNEDSSKHSQKLQPRALAKEPHQKSSFFLHFLIVFMDFALGFLAIPYKSLSFPGNDGPNEGQNDEKMMTKMVTK